VADNRLAIITATTHRSADFKRGKCIHFSPCIKAAGEDGRRFAVNGYYAKSEAEVSSFAVPGIQKAAFSKFPAEIK
jgi:hypothetical protein